MFPRKKEYSDSKLFMDEGSGRILSMTSGPGGQSLPPKKISFLNPYLARLLYFDEPTPHEPDTVQNASHYQVIS